MWQHINETGWLKKKRKKKLCLTSLASSSCLSRSLCIACCFSRSCFSSSLCFASTSLCFWGTNKEVTQAGIKYKLTTYSILHSKYHNSNYLKKKKIVCETEHACITWHFYYTAAVQLSIRLFCIFKQISQLSMFQSYNESRIMFLVSDYSSYTRNGSSSQMHCIVGYNISHPVLYCSGSQTFWLEATHTPPSIKKCLFEAF